MSLRKLLCVVSLGQSKTSQPGHKSMAVTSEAVKEKQIKFLKNEKSTIERKYSQETEELEAKFKELLQQQQRAEESVENNDDLGMDKEQMRRVFKDMNICIEPEFFDKIWLLFDADRNGTVNAQEFVVSTCVLMYRGSVQDNVQLAFRLFDTNRDGTISKREFNDMIAAIIGTHIKNVLDVEYGRECFADYLRSELADELLRFIDKVEYLSDARPATFSREFTEQVWEQFLEVDSPDQINVSQTVRETIRDKLAAYQNEDDGIPVSIFDAAAAESVALIENGPLPRFKHKLRTDFFLFADRVWNSLGLAPYDAMTMEIFREWVAKTPGIFNFLDEMQELLAKDFAGSFKQDPTDPPKAPGK